MFHWVAVTVVLYAIPVCMTGKDAVRELSSITYRLTTCGSAGRMGPETDQQCIDYHRNRSSPVARDNLILRQSTPNYRGGQLVRIPKTTTYNLTVAGASGGKGLCSHLLGRGVVIRAQALLRESMEMLVVVGQRGMGPCEPWTSGGPPLDSFCSLIPNNDSVQCNETWWNYLQSIASNFSLDIYRHIGGGGGGGASMIRLENEGALQNFPFIVAGGGGGGAAVLDLNVLDAVNFSRPVNATREEIYQAFVDGKREEYDPVLSDIRAERGFLAPETSQERSPGAGGGYLNDLESRRVDGSQFLRQEAFGEGGVDCGTSSSPTSFASEVGGFGVGGGGCGGGGGGGGHTGGAIVGTGNVVPGGGGYSFLQSSRLNPLQLVEYGWNGEGDGYVEMVAADCGCAYQCFMYQEEDEFECLCPEFAKLAPDLSDCFHSVSQRPQHRNLLTDAGTGLVLTLVDFGSSSSIYSMAATLSSELEMGESGSGWSGPSEPEYSETSSSDELLCAIIFIGENGNLVLVSNIARSGQDKLTTLSSIDIDFNAGLLMTGASTDFLPLAVTVAGGLLVSLGDCFVKGDLHINSSILGITDNTASGSGTFSGKIKLRDEILANPETTASLLMSLLQNETDPTVIDDTPGADFQLTAWQIVLVGVAAALGLLTLLVKAWICIGCYKQSKKKMRFKRFRSSHFQNSIVSSLTSNALYVSNHDSVFPQLPYNKYTTQSGSQVEMRERYSCSPQTTTHPNSHIRQHSSESGKVISEDGVILLSDHNFCTYNRGRLKSTLRTSEWQYPRSRLIYMRELGEGQFGKVLLMKAQRGIAGFRRDLPVAVKTLASRDPDKVAKFMDEAELMKNFSHPNIVSLLGFSTDDIVDDDNAPLIILEYMPYGDLHAFLVNNKPGSETLSVSLGDVHFVSFAKDVAEAVKFIGDQGFVHRDIAARNCLVGAGLSIKISDFGLAKRLNEDNYCAVEEGSVLPIRTMAPEIFLTGHFTTSSDIWSYGVLLWEMVSYGDVPLPGLTSRDIAEAAQMRNLHHKIPSHCPPVLCSLISQCHTHYPNLRPSFADILSQLTHHR